MTPSPQHFRLFDLVTIINLPERRDRMRQMQEQLRRIGMAPGDVEVFPAMRAATADEFPSAGAHGCFLSHVGCIRRAIDTGSLDLLILEDDVDFAPGFLSMEANIARQLKHGAWQFFFGGGDPLWHLEGGPPEEEADSGLRVIPPNVLITCAHFVGIEGSQLQKLHDFLLAMLERPVGHADGGPMDVDGAYSWFRMRTSATTFLAEPELGHQRSSASDIRTAWQDRIPLLQRFTPLLRRWHP